MSSYTIPSRWKPPKNGYLGTPSQSFYEASFLHPISEKAALHRPLCGGWASIFTWLVFVLIPGYSGGFCFNDCICRANLDRGGKESNWFTNHYSGMSFNVIIIFTWFSLFFWTFWIMEEGRSTTLNSFLCIWEVVGLNNLWFVGHLLENLTQQIFKTVYSSGHFNDVHKDLSIFYPC